MARRRVEGARRGDSGADFQIAQPGDGRIDGLDQRPESRESCGQVGYGACRGPAVSAQGAVHLDFVEAENSTGFHAPQEAVRILGESINFTRQGQIALRGGKTSVQPAQGASKR
jgi:Cytochrome c552